MGQHWSNMVQLKKIHAPLEPRSSEELGILKMTAFRDVLYQKSALKILKKHSLIRSKIKTTDRNKSGPWKEQRCHNWMPGYLVNGNKQKRGFHSMQQKKWLIQLMWQEQKPWRCPWFWDKDSDPDHIFSSVQTGSWDKNTCKSCVKISHSQSRDWWNRSSRH